MPIQAIYADESNGWTPAKLKAWMKEQGYVPLKGLHRKGTQLRYRIMDPKLFASFSTEVLNNHVHLVWGSI
jgi:hypothetical protein